MTCDRRPTNWPQRGRETFETMRSQLNDAVDIGKRTAQSKCKTSQTNNQCF